MYQVVKTLKNHGYTQIDQIRIDHHFFIRKKLLINTPPYRKLFENEQQVHQSLSHKNIIAVKESSEDEFILEYALLGDLRSLLDRNLPFIPRYRPYWIYQIIQGITYLHQQQLIHNDLKLSNIFISRDKRIKIGDFGLSCGPDSTLFQELPPYIFQGTYALNNINNEEITFQRDLYALGVLIFELFTTLDPRFNELDLSPIPEPFKTITATLLAGKYQSITDISLPRVFPPD